METLIPHPLGLISSSRHGKRGLGSPLVSNTGHPVDVGDPDILLGRINQHLSDYRQEPSIQRYDMMKSVDI